MQLLWFFAIEILFWNELLISSAVGDEGDVGFANVLFLDRFMLDSSINEYSKIVSVAIFLVLLSKKLSFFELTCCLLWGTVKFYFSIYFFDSMVKFLWTNDPGFFVENWFFCRFYWISSKGLLVFLFLYIFS